MIAAFNVHLGCCRIGVSSCRREWRGQLEPSERSAKCHAQIWYSSTCLPSLDGTSSKIKNRHYIDACNVSNSPRRLCASLNCGQILHGISFEVQATVSQKGNSKQTPRHIEAPLAEFRPARQTLNFLTSHRIIRDPLCTCKEPKHLACSGS